MPGGTNEYKRNTNEHRRVGNTCHFQILLLSRRTGEDGGECSFDLALEEEEEEEEEEGGWGWRRMRRIEALTDRQLEIHGVFKGRSRKRNTSESDQTENSFLLTRQIRKKTSGNSYVF